MKNKDMKTIFEACSPNEEQKEKILNGILREGRLVHKQEKGKWRYITVAALFCIVFSFSVATVAANIIKKNTEELYMRFLSAEDMNLTTHGDENEQAQKYFNALNSDNTYEQYIAINKLVEYFNNHKIREKAITAITPFSKSKEKKLAQAAQFALAILTGKYNSEKIYKMYDGSIFFTLFNNYSDYGSDNRLWRIKDGVLECYVEYSKPSMYITDMFVSPDGKKIAVATCSNKSSYLTIYDMAEGTVSPALVDTASFRFACKKGYEIYVRADRENYSGIFNIKWENENVLSFGASLSYYDTDIIKEVVVQYNTNKKDLIIREVE